MQKERILQINISRCIRKWRRKWYLIVFVTIAFGILGMVFTYEKGCDLYEAKSTVYSAAAGSYADSITGTSAMNAYADIATSMKVCQRAKKLLGESKVTATQIQNATEVEVSSSLTSSGGSILEIKCMSDNPKTAMQMSQAVAEAFSLEMARILGTEDVKILDGAYNYEKVYDANRQSWKIRIVLLAFGVLMGFTIVTLPEIFGTKVQTLTECQEEDVLLLGVVPRYRN